MIACPVCGSETSVLETRASPEYARRRRRCKKVGCGTKVTTVEVIVHNPNQGRGGEIAWVRRANLERLVEVSNRMLALSSQEPE